MASMQQPPREAARHWPSREQLPSLLAYVKQVISGFKFDETRLLPTVDPAELRTALLGDLFPWAANNGTDPEGAYASLQALNQGQRACGVVFGPHDAVYRCLDCEADPTCVLCGNCFHTSAHRNHNFVMHPSSGGGTCDCGDPEAWKSDHCCDTHRAAEGADLNEGLRSLPPDVIASLIDRLKTIINHALAVLMFPYSCGFPLLDPADWKPSDPTEDLFGTPCGFCLTAMYNDEDHSYQQVINVLMQATHFSRPQAQHTAEIVDTVGRAMYCKRSCKDCREAAKPSANIGLRTEVLDAVVVCRQTVMMEALKCLSQLANQSDCLRRVTCAVLTGCFSATGLDHPDETLADTPLGVFFGQYNVLWKQARSAVRELILVCTMVEPDFKAVLGRAFVENYSVLQQARVKDDQDSSEALSNLSVQLFTTPSLTRSLMGSHKLLDVVLEALLDLLNQVKTGHGYIDCDTEHTILEHRDYWHAMHDLQYILRCGLGSLRPWLPKILAVLRLFHGMDPTTRAQDVHVEMESRAWYQAFTLVVSFAHTYQLLMSGLCSTTADVQESVAALMHAIHTDTEATASFVPAGQLVHGDPTTLVDYDALNKPVTLHIMLHRAVSSMLMRCGQAGMTLKEAFAAADGTPYASGSDMLVALLDPVLRVFAFVAQVKARLWVRNGITVQNQVLNYAGIAFRSLTIDCDLALLQAMVVLLGPDQCVRQACSRFGLTKWFQHEDETLLQAQADQIACDASLVQDFLTLMLQIFAERFCTGVGQVSPREIMRQEVIQVLCAGSVPHSKLVKLLPHDLTSSSEFPAVLGEVSEFKSGDKTFHLKPELVKEYKAHFYHCSAAMRTRAEEHMAELQKGEFHGPSPLPAFAEPFAEVGGLMQNEYLLHLVATVLTRACGGVDNSTSPPTWREDSSVSHMVNVGVAKRALDVLVYGLVASNDAKKFADKVCSLEHKGVSLCEILARLRSCAAWNDKQTNKNEFDNVVMWIVSKLKTLVTTRHYFDKYLAPLEKPSEPEASSADKRAERKKAAQARKAQLMARFSRMQSSFEQSNADELNRTVTRSASSTVASDDQVTCISCQEIMAPNESERCFVLLANATRLSQSPEVPQEVTPMFFDSCGHVMHVDCWRRFVMSCREQVAPAYLDGVLVVGEIFCPLCRALSNFAMPLVPAQLLGRPAAGESLPDWNTRLAELQSYVVQASATVPQGPDSPPLQNDRYPYGAWMAIMMTENLRRHMQDLLRQNLLPESAPERQGPAENHLPHGKDDTPVPELPCLTRQETALARWAMVETKHRIHALARDDSVRLRSLWVHVASTLSAIEVAQRSAPDQEPEKLPETKRRFLVQMCQFAIAQWHASPCDPCLSLAAEFLGGVDQVYSFVPWRSDPFELTAQTLFAAMRKRPLDPQLCNSVVFAGYLYLLTSVVHQHLQRSSGLEATDAVDPLTPAGQFVGFVASTAGLEAGGCGGAVTEEFLARHSVPFLRRVALLKAALLNSGWAAANASDPAELRSLASLPDLAGVVRVLGLEGGGRQTVARTLAQRWLDPTANLKDAHVPSQDPAPVHLAALPSEFTELFHEASGRPCPTTGQPKQRPAICLKCGEHLCIRSSCCQKTRQIRISYQAQGACWRHAQQCGNGTGMFLDVRQCSVILLHNQKGMTHDAPYVDEHGEPDPQLARGRRLTLDRERYAALERMWLLGEIPTRISRQLDQTRLLRFHWTEM